MTVICGGGASQAKPGFNQTVVITASAIEGALILFGLEPLAAVLGPFLAGETYDLTTFCTTDPPADPVLTNQDLLDVSNFGDPTVSIPALAKVRQWFNSRFWYQACQCSSVTTPLPPALSNPGSPSTNYGLPPQGNNPCFEGNFTQTAKYTTAIQTFDLTPSLIPTAGGSMISNNIVIGPLAGLSMPVWPIPATIQEFDVFSQVLEIDTTVSGNGQLAVAVTFTDAAGNRLHTQNITTASAGNTPHTTQLIRSITALWPAGATHYAIGAAIGSNAVASTHDQSISLSVSSLCNGPALGPVCCPPDPTITQKLNQIYGLLEAVWSHLGSGITSYLEGTIHSGLTGSGTVTVATTALAVKANITTLPSYLGSEPGSPPILFDAGFITPANTKGPMSPQRLQFSTQIFLLPVLPAAVDFTLPAGVVLELTELLPGP